MADTLTPEHRSRNMAAIHSKNTKPEIFLRHQLFSLGYRYRICPGYIPGHPDIFLKKYNTAIFVHGCFWHRHRGCKYAYSPKSNIEFWEKKFQANVKRDIQVQQELENTGIKCIIVWECTIKSMNRSSEFNQQVLTQIADFLNNRTSQSFLEL